MKAIVTVDNTLEGATCISTSDTGGLMGLICKETRTVLEKILQHASCVKRMFYNTDS